MMRYFLIGLLALFGCGAPRPQSGFEENGKLKVLSTIGMIDDLVRGIGGEEVDALLLITHDLDPHSYMLVKGDDEKFGRADLIFYNGLGLEHGHSLEQLLSHSPNAIPLGDRLLEKNPSAILTAQGQVDPHIWMDLSLWMETIEVVVTALSEKDPAHAALYKERGERLYALFEATDRSAYAAMQSLPAEVRYLVTSHDAFQYFTHRYLALPEERSSGEWRRRFASPEGIAPDAQLSLTDIQTIVRYVEEHRIHVVFPESNLSQEALRKVVSVCCQKNCPVRFAAHPLYGDSMGAPGSPSDSHIKMIEHNISLIVSELSENGSSTVG